jgi:hypothetical protein
MGVVFCVILLFAGKKAPDEATAVLPYAAVPSLILVIWSMWRYFSIRGDIFITRSGNKFGLTVMSSPKVKALELFSPFVITVGWKLLNFGKGKKTYQLFMIFRDANGNCLLSLESGRHTMLGTPEGWKEISESDLQNLSNEYTCSHLSEMSKLLRAYIR